VFVLLLLLPLLPLVLLLVMELAVVVLFALWEAALALVVMGASSLSGFSALSRCHSSSVGVV